MSRASRNVQVAKKVGQEQRQELVKLIREASRRGHTAWQIWDDLMYMSAAALSQPVKWEQKREDEYLRRIGRYEKETQDLFPQMFSALALAFEQEGCIDILGEIYMQLELFNKWHGQFFTPSHICDFMSKVVDTDLLAIVNKQGFISVNDPTCGGGAMLIAFAKNAQEQGINYQRDVLFVGQDIDPVVARMCYISLSLLGMPGYVVIGNTLTADTENYDYWFTPMYLISGFQWRKQRNETQKPKTENVAQSTKDIIAPGAEYNATKIGQLTLF